MAAVNKTADKMTAVYAKASRQLSRFLRGVCTVYALQPPEQDGIFYGGFMDAAGWQELADWTDLPCYLALLQHNPAAAEQNGAAAGSDVAARGRLFMAVRTGLANCRALPEGSRIRVEQDGRIYWLACSGLAAVYPTHMEADVRLLGERA